jgi:hypothetical protein
MVKASFVFFVAMFLSSCWPGPSYKGLDYRCKEWVTVISRSLKNDDDERRFVKTLEVTDRYQYYSCINVMKEWAYEDKYIFLDDADEFFELAQTLLRGKINRPHLYLITRISSDIAQAKPEVVKKHMELINRIESMVPIGASDFLSEFTLRNIEYIRYYAK